MVEEEIRNEAVEHEERIHQHTNADDIRLLVNHRDLVRQLNTRKPLELTS